MDLDDKIDESLPATDPQLLSVGDRLRFLMEWVYPTGAQPYSQAEVARGASSEHITVTPRQIRGLLSGTTTKPDFDVMIALSGFFKVPPDFFLTPDPDKWDEYVRWIKLMRKKMDSAELYATRKNRFRHIRERRLRQQGRSLQQ